MAWPLAAFAYIELWNLLPNAIPVTTLLIIGGLIVKEVRDQLKG